jgi:hypothetical protein
MLTEDKKKVKDLLGVGLEANDYVGISNPTGKGFDRGLLIAKILAIHSPFVFVEFEVHNKLAPQRQEILSKKVIKLDDKALMMYHLRGKIE